MLCWVLKWYWSSNCDVQSSSSSQCARVRTPSPSDHKWNVRSVCWATTLPVGLVQEVIVMRPVLSKGPHFDRSYFSKIEETKGSNGQTWTYDTWKCWKLRRRRSHSIKKLGLGRKLKLVFYPLIWYFGKNGATKFGKYGHIWYIKMLEIATRSISDDEKGGFSLKNETWWKSEND